MNKLFITLFILIISLSIKAQTNDELLNLLVKKGFITKTQADSIKAKTTSAKKQTLFRSQVKLNFPVMHNCVSDNV